MKFVCFKWGKSFQNTNQSNRENRVQTSTSLKWKQYTVHYVHSHAAWDHVWCLNVFRILSLPIFQHIPSWKTYSILNWKRLSRRFLIVSSLVLPFSCLIFPIQWIRTQNLHNFFFSFDGSFMSSFVWVALIGWITSQSIKTKER